MTLFRILTTAAACLMLTGAAAYAVDFSAFGEDEEVCRHVGEAAIKGASGPQAAQRYDAAHGLCMENRLRARWMQAYRDGPPPPPFYPRGNPDNEDFPNAFMGIPYATPGYGYDGFSPR